MSPSAAGAPADGPEPDGAPAAEKPEAAQHVGAASGPSSADAADRPAGGRDVASNRLGPVWLAAALLALGLLASWSWVLVVVGIVAMIFFHELGHYLTARWTGMKPTEFFIGFGPRLWSFRKGDTEYGVKAIPAGAYVRIVGMNNLEEVDPEEADRAYRSKSYPRKLLVVSAGSIMHFLMALALLYAAILQYGVPSQGWEVDRVVSSSAAAQIGILPGDRIVSVDGEPVDDYEGFGSLVSDRGGQEVAVVFERDGALVSESVVLGVRLQPAGAAAFDGLVPYDRILVVDGREVFGWDDVVDAIDGRIGDELSFVVDPADGDELLVLDRVRVNAVPPAAEAVSGFFGVGARSSRTSLGALSAVPRSLVELGSFTELAVTGMWDFVSGGGFGNFLSDTLGGAGDRVAEPSVPEPSQSRSGPARTLDSRSADEDRILSIYGAARVGALLTDESFEGLVLFLAGLNVFVGLFNMLPLPPLDGGHAAVATYERIRSLGGRRYEVDHRKLLPLTYAVFFVLIAVGLVALFRDIVDPIDFG